MAEDESDDSDDEEEVEARLHCSACRASIRSGDVIFRCATCARAHRAMGLTHHTLCKLCWDIDPTAPRGTPKEQHQRANVGHKEWHPSEARVAATDDQDQPDDDDVEILSGPPPKKQAKKD